MLWNSARPLPRKYQDGNVVHAGDVVRYEDILCIVLRANGKDGVMILRVPPGDELIDAFNKERKERKERKKQLKMERRRRKAKRKKVKKMKDMEHEWERDDVTVSESRGHDSCSDGVVRGRDDDSQRLLCIIAELIPHDWRRPVWRSSLAHPIVSRIALEAECKMALGWTQYRRTLIRLLFHNTYAFRHQYRDVSTHVGLYHSKETEHKCPSGDDHANGGKVSEKKAHVAMGGDDGHHRSDGCLCGDTIAQASDASHMVLSEPRPVPVVSRQEPSPTGHNTSTRYNIWCVDSTLATEQAKRGKAFLSVPLRQCFLHPSEELYARHVRTVGGNMTQQGAYASNVYRGHDHDPHLLYVTRPCDAYTVDELRRRNPSTRYLGRRSPITRNTLRRGGRSLYIRPSHYNAASPDATEDPTVKHLSSLNHKEQCAIAALVDGTRGHLSPAYTHATDKTHKRRRDDDGGDPHRVIQRVGCGEEEEKWERTEEGTTGRKQRRISLHSLRPTHREACAARHHHCHRLYNNEPSASIDRPHECTCVPDAQETTTTSTTSAKETSRQLERLKSNRSIKSNIDIGTSATQEYLKRPYAIQPNILSVAPVWPSDITRRERTNASSSSQNATTGVVFGDEMVDLMERGRHMYQTCVANRRESILSSLASIPNCPSPKVATRSTNTIENEPATLPIGPAYITNSITFCDIDGAPHDTPMLHINTNRYEKEKKPEEQKEDEEGGGRNRCNVRTGPIHSIERIEGDHIQTLLDEPFSMCPSDY